MKKNFLLKELNGLSDVDQVKVTLDPVSNIRHWPNDTY